MNKIKYLAVCFTCTLTACMTHRPAEMQNYNPSPMHPSKTKPTPMQSTAPTEPVMKIQKGGTKTASSFEIQGVMAAKAKGKSWSATMHWAQLSASTYQIRLMGPLGNGSVILSKRGDTVTFQDGRKVITSSNADDLLYRQTGVRIPVNKLYYWVRGLPAPGGLQGEQRDEGHHLVALKQEGYNLSFGQYTSVNGRDLPTLIRLDGNGLLVKMIIKRWNI